MAAFLDRCHGMERVVPQYYPMAAGMQNSEHSGGIVGIFQDPEISVFFSEIQVNLSANA